MKQNNAIAYLRRLCCSGLSKEMVIAEFLRAVRILIPSSNNTFSGTDAQFYPRYHIAGFDVSAMRDTIPAVVASFHTSERQQRAIAWFQRHAAITDARILDQSFYRSDMYQLVYREFDMHHVLWMPVSQAGKPAGVLGLYRPKSQNPFSSHDQAQLGHLLQYVAHALAVDGPQEPSYSDSGRSGMMIMNTRGEILCKSQEAEQLLNLARMPRLLVDSRSEDRLLATLAQLCRNLTEVFRGKAVAPPSYCHVSPYGRFLFRAYRLQDQHDEPQDLVGLSIEHQEPVALQILRAMQDLPLSPMQQEVAQCVAQGMSFEHIGRRLHIKPTTVKDHVGKIYNKLDIGQREELLPKLLALAG